MISRICKASVGVKLSSNKDHWGSPELEMCLSAFLSFLSPGSGRFRDPYTAGFVCLEGAEMLVE